MTNQSYFHGFSPSLSRISIYRETTLPQTGTNNGQLKMLGLGPYTPSKILSYMGIPCSAVASFMGVIAQVRDLFMSLIHTCELSDANPFDYLIQLQNHASELAESPRD
jgi:hypothetical protein